MPMATDAMIADTTHLTAEEFGAYHFILYATWRNNGVPLPDDDRRLARVCRVTLARWRRLRGVLTDFFDLSEGTWRQKRLEKEWDYVAQRRRALRANAAKGGRAKARKEQQSGLAKGSPQAAPKAATHTQTHTQTHTLKREGKETPPPAPPLGRGSDAGGARGSRAQAPAAVPQDEAAWQAFWAVYPSRGRYANPRQPARQRFLALLRRGIVAERMIAGAKAYGQDMAAEPERRLVAQAQTFLKQQRWEQYEGDGGAAGGGGTEPGGTGARGTGARGTGGGDAREDAARAVLKSARWAERAPRWAALAEALAKAGGRLPPYIKAEDLARLKAEGRIDAATYSALAAGLGPD